MVRTQTGSANKERPYRHGQELELTITQDSGWQKRYPRIPAEKRTPTEQKWAAARAAAVILVAGTVVAGVAIGGNGNRMSNDERTSQAKNKVIETVQGMTGAEQYATLYINGGPENKVASFDDSSGQNVFNTGLSRLAAEYSDAHVYMGDNCLANSAYNTRGRQPAAYKETLDGQVAIVSQGRSRLHFELEGGVLQPRDDSTIATLTSLNCDATGIPAGLTNESSFVVGFAEAAQ